MFWFIYAILNFIVWGFDYKYDPDTMTWVWFGTGILWLLVGILTKLKLPNSDFGECPKCGKKSCYVICSDEGCGEYAADIKDHLA